MTCVIVRMQVGMRVVIGGELLESLGESDVRRDEVARPEMVGPGGRLLRWSWLSTRCTTVEQMQLVNTLCRFADAAR